MASTAEYKCKSCGNHFTARTADRARGWARFCSKSCKATKQYKTKPTSYQRFDECRTLEDKLEMLENPRIIRPLYNGWGERDGEEFYANFSNEEGSDI